MLELKKEVAAIGNKEIPIISNVSSQQVHDNYYQVKMDVRKLLREEVARLKSEKVIDTSGTGEFEI